MEPTLRSHYLHWTRDLVRYGDTDRQGHVNNAVFATFLETGRVAVLYHAELRPALGDAQFVLAKVTLEYRAQIHWPAEVWIGTRVQRIGRSSIGFEQGLFVEDRCSATSESIVVMVDAETGKSTPIPEDLRRQLGRWSRSAAAAD
jgi:acyl-CoA thioester hydrolase